MEKEGAVYKRYDSQSDRQSVYGSERGSSDAFRQRKSQAENQSSWGRSSSSSEDQSWKRPTFSRDQSWKRPSSSGDQSWKRPNVRHNSESANARARPEERCRVTASALQLGKVLNLDLIQAYGFLAPVQTVAPSNNVYFRFAGASNVETGMLQLEVGDIFEFVSNESPDRPRAIYACLVQCNPRSPEALLYYLYTLLTQSQASTGSNVLREITKCPAGFLQVLNFQKPPFDLVHAVLELVNVISHHNETELYTARLKQFYRLFRGTALLHWSLKEYGVVIFNSATAEKLLKKFLISLAEHCPETVSDVLPLLNDMVLQTKSGQNIGCHCQFLLGLLTAQAGNAISATNDTPSWNKMPLLPEITGSRTDETALENCLKGLPSVKEGSYGSVDVYMDTYFRLLQADCFWGLKKGISVLRQKSRRAGRNIRIWTNGVILGIHFGGSYSGITVAIQVEKLKNNKRPMSGSLLCLSDDGENFDSPIWAVVAHCEDSKQGMVIFAGIVDGRGGAGDVEIKAIGRLLSVTSNIVLAESPTFYKAYQPVLKALQEKDTENFPFIEELVYAKWPNKPPDYLTPTTTVNWSCLFNKGKESPTKENVNLSFMSNASSGSYVQGYKEANISQDNSVQEYSGTNAIRGQVHEMDNFLKSGYKTSLDDSQIKAIKLALSNRLVLIQGPPGTGKSYVGVKILELLLTGSTLPPGPILVMTYKNHGLDNFLLSCLKFCPNLVRIGGRSEEPDLMPHNLSSKIGRMNEHRSDWIECKLKLEQVQAKMEIALHQLRESNFLNVESLMDYMPDKQVRQLVSKTQFGEDLLGHFPQEISLQESIRGGLGRGDQETRNVVTLLYKTLSKNMKEWMPKKETFELVENCFSTFKPLQRLDETGYTNTRDTGSEDDEETSDFEEYEEEIDVQSNHETRNETWLKENFFPCRREANDSWSSGGANRLNVDIDLNRYQWLLHENPWHLNQNLRVLLVQVITQANYEKALKSFADIKTEYAEICEVMKEINQLRQLEVLRGSQIVGMTTTGAALYRDVLKKLRPSIIFVEEASEILESQLLAVLEPTIQHLIMIGDQYQLSPRVACNELERWHGFEVSMFERLVEYNKMPFQSLAVQGRMREEFVPMLLPIYPYLRSNTKLVTGERNGSPACMMSPMYFWSHSYPETRQRSAANDGEATMVVSLLRWMIAEGENPSNITVLAAYGGQVSLLRKKLETCESTRNLQVHTIDRFQGSENKMVVVSLVRSNEDGCIGFLAKRNRLCVSVSRARGAIYFCGSCTTFSRKSPHWKTLLHYFQDRKCLGEQIFLRCPRHPSDPPFTICSSEVNSFHPLLCERPCKSTLDCNHQCESTCHHGDHPECRRTVQFLFRDCGHEATKQCSEKEETILCKKEITYTFEACQHTDVFKCWRIKTKSLKCMQVCPNKLECGHPCTLKCYENCKANPCSICVKIKKEQAAKEKLREAEELKQKLKELDNEIERLKLQDDTGGTSLIELDSEGETAAQYFQVKDRTEKFIQPLHGILPIVTKIEKVCNLKFQIKFAEAQRHLISPMSPTQLLFHGSSNDGIQGIVEKGFRLPPADKRNMFGQGIYFATDSSKSAQTIYTRGSNKILLCEVLLGKTWTVQKPQSELDKKRINKKGYDSLFSKREGREKGGTLYDEFVVYDPHQAIPRYIVHYKNLKFDPAAMLPSQISTDQNLTRIQYHMSPNFSGDSPAEYHFRLAESQFFRMSSGNDYKVTMVELIINKTLQLRYEKAKEEFRDKKKSVEERLVFHGTEKNAIEKIIEEGFKIGGEGVAVLNGAVYGSGVYTALDPNISIPYSKGGSTMLLSFALLGEPGKDYNNGGSADVLVLKKAEYLLPKYIVHFTKK